MLAGYPPFFDSYPFGIYEKILAGKIEWSRQIDPVAKDLIKKLLVQDRTKRLGNMKVRPTTYFGPEPLLFMRLITQIVAERGGGREAT